MIQYKSEILEPLTSYNQQKTLLHDNQPQKQEELENHLMATLDFQKSNTKRNKLKKKE